MRSVQKVAKIVEVFQTSRGLRGLKAGGVFGDTWTVGLTPSLCLEATRFARRPAALSALNRWKGRRRAEFWRKLGFPNLVRARAAKARKRKQRLAQARDLSFSPFALSAKERPRGF